MLLLWVLILGVCGDVVLSMEGPRGKVTREMCSKPASQVPEEHWPYCCEGYGNHCEDFAASCYLDCQPVVSSGSDVTMVEERPGFCCALYNFCCIREFSRIGTSSQNVEAEEQFPTFHRFHIPGKQAPRSPAPRKNIVRQDVNNDISESPSTVNRIGRPRTPSRNNRPRERLDQIDSKSPKSLDELEDRFTFDVKSSEQLKRQINSKANAVKPQRSSNQNTVKPQRNQVRFPQRSQNDKTNKVETSVKSEITTSNVASENSNKEPAIQGSDSFGKIAPIKRTVLKAKNIDDNKENKNINQNTQQLNSEAENRKITINRAGVNRREKLGNTNVNLKPSNKENQELKPANQPKSVSLPAANISKPKINTENNSENKQVKEDKTQKISAEKPSTTRQNNGRKVKIGRRVLVRTAPKKISKTEQESSRSIESEQSKLEVRPTTSRRTLISNRQIPKTTRNDEADVSKSTDTVQSRQTAQPTTSRRTLISNRQTSKTIRTNEQEVSKSTGSLQSRQIAQPTAGRTTILSSRKNTKEISNNKQEISKSTESVQSKKEAKPTAGRRTLISNRQSPIKIINDEQESSKSSDSTQSRQELNPTGNRRTILSNRQNTKKIDNIEKEISRTTDTVQSRQEVKPISSRRTILSNRQTGSRRSRPTVSSTQESTANQEQLKESTRSGDRNRGRRIKQTVRRVIPDNTQQESVKLATSTTKEQKEVLPKQRISIPNKRVSDQILPVNSPIEKEVEILSTQNNDKLEKTTDANTGTSNTDKTTSYLPLSKEGKEAPKMDLDSSASQISEDRIIDQNNVKISEQEKSKPKDETDKKSPVEIDESTAVTETNDKIQNSLETSKVNKVNENQKEIEASPSSTNNQKKTRTRSRTTIPIDVTSSRNRAIPSTGETSSTTSSRTRTRSRSSRTRNQGLTQQEETISSTTTTRGTHRSGRIESFGSRDASKSPVQNSSINSENTARGTTRRRGRQLA